MLIVPFFLLSLLLYPGYYPPPSLSCYFEDLLSKQERIQLCEL